MTFESSWFMRGVYRRTRPLCAASLPTDRRGLSTWVDRWGAYRVAPGVGSVEGLLRRVPEPGVIRRELPDRRPVAPRHRARAVSGTDRGAGSPTASAREE